MTELPTLAEIEQALSAVISRGSGLAAVECLQRIASGLRSGAYVIVRREEDWQSRGEDAEGKLAHIRNFVDAHFANWAEKEEPS